MLLDDENWQEDILETPISDDTTPEDRFNIEVMVGRLKRVLQWDPGEDDVLFDKSRGPEIIRDIMAHFERWKQFASDFSNLVGVQHLVIYSLAKLCFFYWIMDSKIVVDVLRQVYACDGHFSWMFANIINPPTSRNSLWPSPCPEVREKQHLSMMFFLSHAHRAKLQFSGTRFVDVRLQVPLRVPPTFVAAIYSKPKLLLVLLRYGAELDWRPGAGLSDVWDINMLMRHLIRLLWSSLGSNYDSWNTAVVSNTLSNARECMRILLRVVRQIPMEELNFSLMNFSQSGITLSNNSHEFIRTLSERDVLPQVVCRYMEPSELQHLCRCTVREALNKNWNLPYGIRSLPLPKPVQMYLDILKD